MLTKHVDTANALQSANVQVVEEKNARQNVSKRLSETLEQKTTIDTSLREERVKAENLEKENQALKENLQAKKEAEAKLAEAAATNPRVAQLAPPVGSCSTWIAQAGITNPIAVDLITRESGCNPCIVNGGAVDCNYSGDRAYGIPQSLPGNKMASHGADWKTNPVTQLRWMQDYVMGRYGSWEAARAHHDANNWY